LIPLRPALASVTLVSFTAAAQGDGAILLTWVTATEQDTIGFRIYRADSAAPADWGQALASQPAQGNAQSGGTYEYADVSVTPGVRYYYLLEDITASNTTNRWYTRIASAGVNLPADTPTPTATTPVSGGATTQPPFAGGGTITPTAPPTATRQFTNTPVVSPVQPAPIVQPVQPVAPQATPLPGAAVTAPTAAPPAAPPLAAAPAAPVVALTEAPLAPPTAPALQPTAAIIAGLAVSPPATATPIPAKDATPAVFAAESSRPAAADAQAPEPGGRNTGLLLALGGTAIGLGGLITAVVLFMRSRRS
jgi:hypothetical protein